MNKRNIFVALMLVMLCVSNAKCGDWSHKLGIEVGSEFFFDAENAEFDAVREGTLTELYKKGYVVDNDKEFKIPELYYFGLKSEFLTENERIGLSAGVRFSIFNYEMISNSKSGYLWAVDENEYDTQFVRISSIKQYTYSLGVPLEARFFFNDKSKTVRPYVKLGLALNWNVGSKESVRFVNDKMNKYEDKVIDQLPSPSFSGILYPAFGLKIGRGKMPHFNIDVHAPSVLIDGSASSLLKDKILYGTGFQLTIQMPIFNNTNK